MATQKTYITWTRFMADPRYLVDPTHSVNTLWGYTKDSVRQLELKELSYGNVPGDLRLLAIVEWDDAIIDQAAFDRFILNYSYHSFAVITPQKAVDLCNAWYPPAEGDSNYFSLDADGFTLIDNKPEEGII